MANPYFNAAYYLANNQDLVIAGYTEANAEEHYNEFGAGEGRAPNNWFDAEAYLLSNPDLISGGITLATALQHFADHGVYEGRIFNANPALDPSNFTAADYAEKNPDVAEAFGIDPEDVTPEQAAQLLSHFLIYGIAEKRDGAGDDFSQAINAGTTIEVWGDDDDIDGYVNVGTTGDDTFEWDVGYPTNANVNGLAGNDTLKVESDVEGSEVSLNIASVEHIEIGQNIASVEVKGTGVESITLTKDAEEVKYSGQKVSSITMRGAEQGLVAAFAGVAGAADSLSLNIEGEIGALEVNGIEQVDITLGAKAAGVRVQSDNVNSDSLVFNVTGGKADQTVELAFESVGSGKLETVTIDASGVVSDVVLTAVSDEEDEEDFGPGLGELVNVDAVITTGSGDDVIYLAGGFDGREVTVNAGAGDDFIVASLGTDTITGGAGEDFFGFAAGSAAVALDDAGEIVGIDTITDFKVADDDIGIEGLTAAAADEDFGLFTTDAKGLVTFATGYGIGSKDLVDVVKDLSTNIAVNQGVVFSFENTTYVFVSGGVTDSIEDDGLIQLTGVKAGDIDVGTFTVDVA